MPRKRKLDYRRLEPDAVQALEDLEDAHWKAIHQRPIVYSITESDVLLYHLSARLSLEDVIANELETWGRRERHDRTIWRGARLLAVIRANGTTKPVVIHIDQTIPS